MSFISLLTVSGLFNQSINYDENKIPMDKRAHTKEKKIYGLLESLIGIKEAELQKKEEELKNTEGFTLNEIKQKVQELKVLKQTYNTRKEKLEKYIKTYDIKGELGKFLYGNTFEKPVDMLKENSHAEFKRLNNYYKYFETTNQKQLELTLYEYEIFYRVCHYTAEVIENTNSIEVAKRAYKMMALFNNLKNVDSFIKANGSNYQKPVHDIFQNEISDYKNDLGEPKYNLRDWKKLLDKPGMGLLVIQNLELAEQVEEKLHGRAPGTKEELNMALSMLYYNRYEENPELAQLFYMYNASYAIFNRTLDLIANGTLKIKKTDNMPSIVVDIGQEIDENKQGYYLTRLPAGDPRGLILGEITGCCQSIQGDSEICVIDGMTRQNNGFYVLIKAANKGKNFNPNNIDWKNFEKEGHDIIGQAYAWRGKYGNMTFDSWENLRPESDDAMMIEVLQSFAFKMFQQDPTILRVTIGQGGRTPVNIKKLPTCYAEDMLEGKPYREAYIQIEIWVSEKLKAIRMNLASITGIEDQSTIVSTKQAEKIIEFWSEYKEFLTENYYVLTLPIFIDSVPALSVIYQDDKRNFKFITTDIIAILIFTLTNVKPESFKNLSIDLTSVFLSGNLLTGYKKGYFTVEDFKELKILKNDGLRHLVENFCTKASLEGYKKGYFTIEDFKDLTDNQKIYALTSSDAISAYREKYCIFKDLKDLSLEKIKLLTSSDAIKLYKSGQANFKDLVNLDEKLIAILVECSISLKDYTAYCNFHDLKDLDIEKISTLIKGSKAGLDFEMLKDSGLKKIKLLTSLLTSNLRRSRKIDFYELLNLDEDLIEILIQKQIRLKYYLKQDIKDEKKVQLLMSAKADYAYGKGYFILSDLKNLSSEKIELLISQDAINLYESKKVNFKDLVNLDEQLIAYLVEKSISPKNYFLDTLSQATGTNLFGARGAAGNRAADVTLIRNTLLNVMNNIEDSGLSIDFNNLKAAAGILKWGIAGKPETSSGLSQLIYQYSSYTNAGLITGGITFNSNNVTFECQNAIRTYLMQTALQQKNPDQKNLQI